MNAIVSALGMRGMTSRAQKAVEELRAALPSNPSTVAAYVTGSQVIGTATEHSDLDIYHIVRGAKWDLRHWDVINGAVGNIMDVDVIVDSVESLDRSVNVYGTFEYWAVREGVVIYYDDGSADWRTVLDTVADNVCLPDCAPKWLDFAEWCKNEGDTYIRKGGLGNTFPCIIYRRSVSASIMAALTYDDVRFPHMKRLADLAGTLRDRSILCG